MIKHTVKDRFIKYVQIDTQADPMAECFPSTEKQKNLSRILVNELHEMGIKNAEMDENGYVYASIPSNSDKKVPTICFCSHVDTAPDASGTGVIPILHEKYDGHKIVLPKDNTQVLSPENHKYLGMKIGDDIITTSGDTLLGADDKSGLAIIMDMAHYFINHPEEKHGKISILFTPDEEVGRGVDFVNLDKVDADFAYTMDGGRAGEVEDETFSADAVTIEISGVPIHPGYAKGKMENAIKIASEIVAALPKDRLCPESTSKKQGFVHPTRIAGQLESATLEFIIRDFEDDKLIAHEDELKAIMNKVLENYPNSSATFTVKEQYRNMKKVLDKHPEIVGYAEQAIRETGLTVVKEAIRGGTDGSRLSFMGLPCPNIFTGMQGIHSVQEWISVQDMEKAVKVAIRLCQICEKDA